MSPLAGRTIVVTRPERHAASLARLIEEAGGRALRVPAIEIEPLGGPDLDAVIGALETFDLAVFISRNAVDQGLTRIRERRAWPARLQAAAVGTGTRRALEAEGVANVIAPAGPADSEALLDQPQLKAVAGRRIAIFRGAGGREVLAETLRARGATVVYAECYRRIRPATDVQPLIAEWSRGAVHAVTVSSGEGLANFAAMLGEAGGRLFRVTPVFVPHPRVAEEARSLGIGVALIAGAADAEVLGSLVAYFRGAG